MSYTANNGRKPRVIIAMIEAGGGHKSVSKAIGEALEELYPQGLNVEILDFSLEVGAEEFDAKHKAQWNLLLDKPHITRVAYRLQDAFGAITRFVFLQWAKEFVEKSEIWFEKNEPDVFVSTHWLNAAIFWNIKKQRPDMKCKHIYYLTEPLDASSIHIWREADSYLVGSERVARIYRSRGIDPDKIKVVGFPVSPSFFRPSMTRDQVFDHYGLDKKLPLLVMSCGAEGLGSLAAMSRKVIAEDLPLNVVVVCGRNEKLRIELEQELGEQNRPRVKAVGFTPDMPNLTSAADIVALKSSPGGTFEAIFSRKPAIFIEGVAAYEGIVARLAQKSGAGWTAKRPEQLIKLLRDLLQNPQKLAACSEAAAHFGMENGAFPVAREIGRFLGYERMNTQKPAARESWTSAIKKTFSRPPKQSAH